MARRCFATTGIGMRLTFTCNGQAMGAEVTAEHAAFHLEVAAPEPLYAIQIVRDGEDVREMHVQGNEVDHAWHVSRQESGEFWYCRVILENGEMAWSSPIWLV